MFVLSREWMVSHPAGLMLPVKVVAARLFFYSLDGVSNMGPESLYRN